MTSLPYPTFLHTRPIPIVGSSLSRESNNDTKSSSSLALAAVGRCCIHPMTMDNNNTNTNNNSLQDEYMAIVSKCIEHYNLEKKQNQNQNNNNNEDEIINKIKKEKKKLMKQSVAMAKKYLIQTLQLDISIIDVDIKLSMNDINSTGGFIIFCFLDAGINGIVIQYDNNDKNDDENDLIIRNMNQYMIPKERLVIQFNINEMNINMKEDDDDDIWNKIHQVGNDLASTILLQYKNDDVLDFDMISNIMKKAICNKNASYNVVIQIDPSKYNTESSSSSLAELVGRISKECGGGDKCGHTVTLIDPTATELGLSYAECIRTDRPDGLFTTVVCTRSNEALGLVYSSKESVVAALECGRGVYHSRSRGGLWRKGDSSGHYQTLHRIDVDCDGDALRFTVTQRGDDVAAFCHLNTLTCWGEPRGLRHLENTLRQRLTEDAPEGSYTKRLFEDSTLLRNKLVEEAQELSEAESREHVAEELADVLYFALVRAAKAGVSLDDAVVELDRRARKVTRRKGDSKAFRIAAGDAILNNDKNQPPPKET